MSEVENSGQLTKLAAEYRPSMDRDVLHSWAGDVVKAITSTRAPSDQAGWQHIASMPLWEVGVVTDGYRADCAQKAQGDHDEEGEFYFAVDPEDGLEWEPTHWMPLPATPTLTAGEGGGDE